MDIMKKYVILISTIFLAVTILIGYRIYNKKIQVSKSTQNNKAYESFYNKEVLGTDVISIMNKAIDDNEKNLINKNKKGYYIENNVNSIKIDIRFKELDQDITMDRIQEVGMQQFWKNYASYSFKCTKIEYHKKTGNVRAMYFEQI